MKVNTEIDKLKSDLIDTLNKHNNLPIGVVYYVFKDCFSDVSMAYQQSIQQEQNQESEEENDIEEV